MGWCSARWALRFTRDSCDLLVSIPMRASGLNVSVASGICLREARRRRS
jgi:23S rRNA (guanosine2251-2'-O)-methyltransferase